MDRNSEDRMWRKIFWFGLSWKVRVQIQSISARIIDFRYSTPVLFFFFSFLSSLINICYIKLRINVARRSVYAVSLHYARFTRIQIRHDRSAIYLASEESRDRTNQWNVERSKSLGSHSILPSTVELTTFRWCTTYFKRARSFHLKFTSTIFLLQHGRLFIRMKARGGLDTFIRSQQSSEWLRQREFVQHEQCVTSLWSMRIEIAA